MGQPFCKIHKKLSFGFGGGKNSPTLPFSPQQGSAQQGHGVCLDRPQVSSGPRSCRFSSHVFFFPGTLPIPSMYGIFTYIWLISMVNVGKYTIHGWYGLHNGV